MSVSRISRGRRRLLTVAILCVFALASFRKTLLVTFYLLSLPATWGIRSEDFLLGSRDGFDITFQNYSSSPYISNSSSEVNDLYPHLVPQILHHIRLGNSTPKVEWQDARNACLSMHPNWEAISWTDENARTFVKEKYPELLGLWESYKFPIQRVDALRYMVLYHYGGVILDMDLYCLRPLTPLTRFPFLAPAAHPIGFSNGFLMAQKEHFFIKQLIENLRIYNKNWFGLPYASVMFSTGCHYASTVHSLQPDRSQLKILGGTPSNPNLHALNGNVTTPLFHHLGASSWHSFDASLIVSIGKLGARSWIAIGLLFVMLSFGVWGVAGWWRRRGEGRGRGKRRWAAEGKIEDGDWKGMRDL